MTAHSVEQTAITPDRDDEEKYGQALAQLLPCGLFICDGPDTFNLQNASDRREAKKRFGGGVVYCMVREIAWEKASISL